MRAGLKEERISADGHVLAHRINLSTETAPAAHAPAEQSRTFCLLPGNLNFKVVAGVCVRVCERAPHCVCAPRPSCTSCFRRANICLMLS